MPKAAQYNKGSIIYFENDKDERIFILQKGVVILTSTDPETGMTETQQVSNGEFFGVKSALGHFPREETATVLQDTVAISMSVAEFENIYHIGEAVEETQPTDTTKPHFTTDPYELPFIPA